LLAIVSALEDGWYGIFDVRSESRVKQRELVRKEWDGELGGGWMY
jgi:hypothetical protein